MRFEVSRAVNMWIVVIWVVWMYHRTTRRHSSDDDSTQVCYDLPRLYLTLMEVDGI